jgi:hypothetical protein
LPLNESTFLLSAHGRCPLKIVAPVIDPHTKEGIFEKVEPFCCLRSVLRQSKSRVKSRNSEKGIAGLQGRHRANLGMNRDDRRFDMSLDSFKSGDRAEAICEAASGRVSERRQKWPRTDKPFGHHWVIGAKQRQGNTIMKWDSDFVMNTRRPVRLEVMAMEKMGNQHIGGHHRLPST